LYNKLKLVRRTGAHVTQVPWSANTFSSTASLTMPSLKNHVAWPDRPKDQALWQPGGDTKDSRIREGDWPA
jgi:hypothetical protein